MKDVILDDITEVTQAMRVRLAAALKKNQLGLPSVDMMY